MIRRAALVVVAAFALPIAARSQGITVLPSPGPTDLVRGVQGPISGFFTVNSLAVSLAGQLKLTPSQLAPPTSQAQATFPTTVGGYPYVFPPPGISVPGFVAPNPVPSPTGTASAAPSIAVGYEQDGHVIAFAPSFDNNPYGGRTAAFGYNAMANESIYALEEAAFGWNALANSNTGQYNVAFGPEALRYLGSAGTYAGGVNAAQNNVAVGPQALLSLCSIVSSAPNGVTPCTLNDQGVNDVAVGEEVMYLATTASNDTGVGQNACWDISTGGANVCIGANALQNTTTGSYNTAIGVTALGNATTASSNIAIGFDADYSANASNDICIGQQACYTGSGGSNATVGYQSLYGLTTGYSNAALGFGAGTVATTGYRLTLLGAGTQPAAAGDNTEIAIGYGVTGHGSNTATIGSAASTPAVYLGASGIVTGTAAFTGACSPYPVGMLGIRTDTGAASGSEVYVCRNVSGTGTWEALSGG